MTNYEDLEKKALEKAKKREKKKKPKMKISGKSIFKLGEIIKKKALRRGSLDSSRDKSGQAKKGI